MENRFNFIEIGHEDAPYHMINMENHKISELEDTEWNKIQFRTLKFEMDSSDFFVIMRKWGRVWACTQFSWPQMQPISSTFPFCPTTISYSSFMIGLPSPLKLIINSLEIESWPAIDWLCDLGEKTCIIGDLDLETAFCFCFFPPLIFSSETQ